jgi:hypothetical protein
VPANSSQNLAIRIDLTADRLREHGTIDAQQPNHQRACRALSHDELSPASAADTLADP